MAELNQYAISKALGSKVGPIGRIGFGHFNLRPTSEELKKSFVAAQPPKIETEFSYKEDALVVHAFEDVREGAPTDELLWNSELAGAFIKRCHKLGLQAPDSYYTRRLINVRKNAPRYRKHGIEISPTTKKETHPSIVPKYAHAIEFALVKLRYRHGVSIDDILMDRSLGAEFECLAAQIAKGISSKDLRLGALYIRKNRVINLTEIDAIQNLDLEVVEHQWKGPVSLAKANTTQVPEMPGLIELKEEKRYLYISRNANIHVAVEELRSGDAFRLIANGFWKPRLEDITLYFASGHKIGGVSIDKWERKLIYERDPVLNWPMPKKAA